MVISRRPTKRRARHRWEFVAGARYAAVRGMDLFGQHVAAGDLLPEGLPPRKLRVFYTAGWIEMAPATAGEMRGRT